MKSFILLLLFANFVKLDRPTQVERIFLLDMHNQVRREVKPTAKNMMEMVYDKSMEALADKWVAHCSFKHPGEQDTEYKGTGQNLASLTGKLNLRAMLKSWYSENASYTYSTKHCTKVCGHYTQMVWATSWKVGCAYKVCNNLFPGYPTPQYLLACQYKPPGNYYNAFPYQEGQSCKACPNGTKCRNRLCSSSSTAIGVLKWNVALLFIFTFGLFKL